MNQSIDRRITLPRHQTFTHRGDERVRNCRLHDIIIQSVVNAFNCAFQAWISGNYYRNAVGVGGPHGTNNAEPIAYPIDIQITKKQIEVLILYFVERLLNRACDRNVESMLPQYEGHGDPNTRLIID
jgi:hypothetical protein